MLKNFFKKKENEVALSAAVSGECVTLDNVPDPVFSEKMMGDGCAIKPGGEKVLAPVNGTIIQVFPTKHAVGIEAENGAQILIHVGLETVELEGEGFTQYVEQGDTVTQGETLLHFDKKIIEQKAKSTYIPIVITNTNNMQEIRKNHVQQVTAGENNILFVKK